MCQLILTKCSYWSKTRNTSAVERWGCQKSRIGSHPQACFKSVQLVSGDGQQGQRAVSRRRATIWGYPKSTLMLRLICSVWCFTTRICVGVIPPKLCISKSKKLHIPCRVRRQEDMPMTRRLGRLFDRCHQFGLVETELSILFVPFANAFLSFDVWRVIVPDLFYRGYVSRRIIRGFIVVLECMWVKFNSKVKQIKHFNCFSLLHVINKSYTGDFSQFRSGKVMLFQELSQHFSLPCISTARQ